MRSAMLLLAFVVLISAYSQGSAEYEAALAALDWVAVKKDILTTLTNSRSFWPADYGNYGPFLVRQAWHCSGSYRTSDGHGGCDGGRQRFDPERSWDDNTNLDKAKTVLWPVKQKYGLGLSWGDLIIFAANTAMESMGAPVLGFCAGRQDDSDGSASVLLGPTWLQNKTNPCPVNGKCKFPFGTTTIGLIYLNPEGPMGVPIPEKSAPEVRDAFGRMSMNDTETVALIGGGHAFGKAHGACPLGPGPSPKEQPSNPWPGNCGTGKGKDTFTSGFEGPWSTTPTQWNNNYFKELVNNQWVVHKGPGGHNQWKTVSGPQGIMMLTTDISLLHDPSYANLVNMYATNQAYLDYQFMHAWYKLTTRDMGPITRCVGPFVPDAQPFQNPLPPPPASFPPFELVKKDLWTLMTTQSPLLQPDVFNGGAYYGGVFTQLAWSSASTFRHSDYLGGANGARIRFSPEADWEINVAMDKAIQMLRPIQQKYANLSYADLIVLAGNVALDMAAITTWNELPWCPGRTDAMDGTGSEFLQPLQNYSSTIDQLRAHAKLMRITDREMVALSGRLRSAAQMSRSGFNGSYSMNPTILTNQYFQTLLNEEWQPMTVPAGIQYKAVGKDLFMLPQDLALRWDADCLAIAQEYASDNDLFIREFQAAWTKVMTADRFDGPTRNLCNQ